MTQTQSPLVSKVSESAAALESKLKELGSKTAELQSARVAIRKERKEDAKRAAESKAKDRAEYRATLSAIKQTKADALAALGESAQARTGQISEKASQHDAARQKIIDEANAKLAAAKATRDQELAALAAQATATAKAEADAVAALNRAGKGVAKLHSQLRREQRRLDATKKDTIVSRVVNWVQEQIS